MALLNVLITLNFYIVNAIFCQTFNLKISSSVALIDISSHTIKVRFRVQGSHVLFNDSLPIILCDPTFKDLSKKIPK